MGVYKLSANSVKNGRTNYGSMLAGNTAYTIPGDYQSIATVTVGAGSVSTVSFTSIPSTYSHLQIRYFAKSTPGNDYDVWCRFNSDTGSNYSGHRFYGDGSSFGTSAPVNDTKIEFFGRTSNGTSVFSTNIVDILDYSNTNKYKTTRALYGWDNNSSGFIMFSSGNWRSTNAISSIDILMATGNFAQYSHFALYGIKAVA